MPQQELFRFGTLEVVKNLGIKAASFGPALQVRSSGWLPTAPRALTASPKPGAKGGSVPSAIKQIPCSRRSEG